MRSDISYEVTDLRTRKEHPLGPVAIIEYKSNGLRIVTAVSGLVIDLTNDADDDDSVVDREDEGVIEFNTPDGLVILTRLRLANYRERVYPYLNDNPGPFDSDDAVNHHFYRLLYELGD